MASPVLVTPESNSKDKSSRHYLVVWINNLLKTRFKDVRQMGSGACHCQMMDLVVPGSVDMTQVKFGVQSDDDCMHNFGLLCKAFDKSSITKTIPIVELIRGDSQINFEFIKWFKALYLANQKRQGGKNISPTVATTNLLIEDLQSSSGNFLFNEKWMYIYDWADQSPLGDNYTYCRACNRSLKTLQRGPVELRRHGTLTNTRNGLESTRRPDAAVSFINKHCYTGPAKSEHKARLFARCRLGSQYPTDITSACQHTPYCLQRTAPERKKKATAVVETVKKGLYAIADASCHAGIKALSNRVQEFMVDMHAHHSSCSTKNDDLTAVFGSDISADDPLDLNCLKFCLLVTNILEVWTGLIAYFKSCDGEDEKAKSVCSQLQDPKVRATFLFLQHALKPLHSFQSRLQAEEEADRADMLLILQEASKLLSTYTSYFLRPEAAGRFLKERDARILKDKSFHLSGSEINVGGKAVEGFEEEALSFYAALTGCIAEKLPLGEETLRSISQLLNPRSRQEVTGKSVGELGASLGICSSEEEEGLIAEFLEYQKAEGGGSSAQALGAEEATLFSESEALTESDSELTSDGCPSDNNRCKDPRIHAEDDENGDDGKEMSTRGSFGWESSLRQKPQARAVFQAGASTWSTPQPVDQDSRKGLESQEEGSQAEESSPMSKPTPRNRRKQVYTDGKGFLRGELIWGKVKGFSWWPGMVIPWKSKSSPPGMRRVEWFGDGMFSESYTEGLMVFSAFNKCFCKNSYASLPVYKEAIYQIIELAGERCGKSFSAKGGTKEKELKLMLDWASEGFLPSGPEGFLPPDAAAALLETSDSAPSDYQPPPKRKYVFKNKAITPAIIYNRELIREKVKEEGKTIEDFCLSCGSTELQVQHPLFEGGLCLRCKENFTETLFRYDEDGYQSYCTVCCAGQEVILCGNTSCCRCFCKGCLEILVGPGTFDAVKDMDPWSCYMCKPSMCAGNLKLRPDWSVKVQDFFANNSAMAFEPHRVYPSIPADQRRPIRVLSLFDGIATGYLVLKDLGFKLDRYIASEICEDSIAVGLIKHEGKIEYVNDVRTITRKHFYRLLTLMKPKEGDDRPFFWLFENVVFMSGHDKSDICRFLE
ncbi:hypothetical protein KUCAC02_032365, partial [Chaenocephalus aceratus]